MTLPRLTESPLVRSAGSAYFPIAFIARLPFAMMVVGLLTLVVAERDSVALGGLNAAVAGSGTALAGPLLGAAADRLGQRRVLVPLGLFNAVLLGAFVLVVGSSTPDLAVPTGQVGQAGDGRAAFGLGVGPVMVVLVQPAGQGLSAG